MPPIGDAVEAAERSVWKLDAKYGIGMVAVSVIAVALWIGKERDSTYIRETMAADSKSQTKIIEQNSLQLSQNSVQLQQNSEVLKTVLDNNKATLEVVNKALDTIEDQSK